MLMLSRLVRENNIKVVITGEGSDELLAGYDIFKEAKIRVSQIIYPGVIICFRDRMQYKTRDELQCTSFYEEASEIRTGPF